MGLKIKNGVLSGYTPLTRKKPELEIPEGVTEIAPEAFREQPNLWHVKLPASIRVIGERAFEECTDLKEVQFAGDGLKTVGDGAFDDCIRLETCPLPATTETIGSRAFALCKELQLGTMPRGLARIGKSAFDGCKKLASAVLIPEGISSIGDKAFNHCHAIHELWMPMDFRGAAVTMLNDCTGLYDLVLYAAGKECRFSIGKQEQVPDYSAELTLLIEHDLKAALREDIRQKLLVEMLVSGYDESVASSVNLHGREVLNNPDLIAKLSKHGRLINADNVMTLIEQAKAAGFTEGEKALDEARISVFGLGTADDFMF